MGSYGSSELPPLLIMALGSTVASSTITCVHVTHCCDLQVPLQGATAGRADDDTQDGAAQSGDARQPAEGEEDTDQWVQCERCKRWRVVPDEHWQEVSADEGSAWLCENALWDVLDKPPHEPACDPA